MLLSYEELKQIVALKYITNVTPDMINGTSIDVTLGDEIMVENAKESESLSSIVSLSGRGHLDMETKRIIHHYDISPGEFVLVHTEQIFNLPLHLSAEYKLKSSMARIGLESLNAGWCDPGWNGSNITLELCNCTSFHTIRITPGDRIGQVVFFKHIEVPEQFSYKVRGRYNHDIGVRGAKGWK